jgi:lipoprotein Spr
LQKDVFLAKAKYIAFIWMIFLISSTAFAQSSKIVTSKDQAIKKGIYTTSSSENSVASSEKNKTEKRKASNRKDTKKSETKNSVINHNNDDDIVIDNESNYLIEQLINNAADNLGTRYRIGGTSKDGFDCSGLLFSTFKKFDITLPRSSHEMAKIGKVLSPDEYKVGDLIFFRTVSKRISHVGMITEINGDEIKFIHSSTSLGVIISSNKEAYYQRTFAQVNRILE